MSIIEVLSDFNTCTGCNSCINICPKDAIKTEETLLGIRTIIDEKKCVHCNLCRRACQNYAEVELKKPLQVIQGWNNELQGRLCSSSGGFVSSLVKYYISKGNCVYACLFENGRFIFKEVKSIDDFVHFQGSKYVKSDTGSIYREIKDKLSDDRNVLFIGLPCQVQGLKSYLMGKYINNLVTVDLICHGTPSQALYKKYLEEEGYNTAKIASIQFRNKNYYFTRKEWKYEYWLEPFLSGLTYTENCYNCKFARYERVADFTVGDSWGTELGQEEIAKGISLVLCNTEKSVELLDKISFEKHYVNLERAISNNRQLSHSSIKPDNRALFEKYLDKGKSYHMAVFRCYPKKVINIKIRLFPLMRRLKKLSVPPISFTESIQ